MKKLSRILTLALVALIAIPAAAQNTPQDWFENSAYFSKKGDYAEAVRWLRKAAEQGDAVAQKNLGICYSNGKGVTKNYYEAVKWFRKAAEQGNAEGQYNLGLSYFEGNGVAKDISKAYELINHVYQHGNENDKKSASALLEAIKKTPEGAYAHARDNDHYDGKAIPLYKKAAELGSVDAMAYLGRLYYYGNEFNKVSKNIPEAYKWCKKAAEQGNTDSQHFVGRILTKGEGGIQKNETEGIKWLKKAGEKGNKWAQNHLFTIFFG